MFHELKIDEKWEQRLVLKKENKNIGDLFHIKFKIYKYLNQNGEIIKNLLNNWKRKSTMGNSK